jgi:hypothetical protein
LKFLSFAAFRHLYDGGSSALITTQGGESRAVPLDEVIDSATGRGRQRFVDVDTESYQVARGHPVLAGVPETLYLKCVIARVIE